MKLLSTLVALGLLTGLAHQAGLPFDPFGGGRMADGERVSTYQGGGERERACWADGRREGPCRRWYPDGTLKAEGSFEAGRKCGPWRFYTEGGVLDPERTGSYAGDRRIAALADR
ncbi:MAG: hypothetical protein CMJ84_03525 [Planctomycetes bacterium]|nr:hypothetical protein [Planctomycetota bacterium]MDP6409118.1 hypothetical protein [Planctomycetota bacterium]